MGGSFWVLFKTTDGGTIEIEIHLAEMLLRSLSNRE
jgi:hypothetical protein